MGKTLKSRLVAYQANGSKLGLLPEPTSYTVSFTHDAVGALTVSYSRKALRGEILDRRLETGLEIAVEVSDGGRWIEPYNGRFVIASRSRNALDVSDTVSLTGVSYGWLLKKALNLDTSRLETSGDEKGTRKFANANAGTIMRTFMDENWNRGGVKVDCSRFTPGADSAGKQWGYMLPSIYYDLGISIQDVLDSLVNNGLCDWRTDARQLLLWNADSVAICRDLSKSCVVTLAQDVSEAPDDESIDGLASSILVRGDNINFRQDNPNAPKPWGGWELYSSQQGVNKKETAEHLIKPTLANAARVRGQYTRSVNVVEASCLPLTDYTIGDWITAPTVANREKVRVQQVTLQLDSTGFKASLILNDKNYDSSVRLTKRMNGITGGAHLGGASGAIPAPEKDHRVPKAPQNLSANSDAYINVNGYARGMVTARWDDVTLATDGTAMDITSYAVEYRVNKIGYEWHSAGTTTEHTLSWSNLDCGVQILIRVRAVPSYSDQMGEWSSVFALTVAKDTTPPPVPSKPILSSELGVVSVAWDGKTADGGSMPIDWDRNILGERLADGGFKEIAAVSTGIGDYVITGLTAGTSHTYAFRAVDHAGNKSDWSASASVTVASAISQEEVDKIQADLAANNAVLKDNADKLSQARQDIDKAQRDILDNAAKTSTAQDTADSATAAAGAAQGTAADARDAASAAQSVADAAKTAAASATATAGQAKTVADAAQKAAASAKDTADNAETLANTANDAAASAKSDAANAKTTASNASSVATQAKATADRAAQAATDAAGTAQKANTAAAAAAGIANGKADVIIQSTTPDTSMRKATTLWIDTTGGANTPKRWNGSVWMAVTDKTATDAANAAVKANNAAKTAQSTADKAQTAAANAASQANQANAAAKKAQTTADGKNLIYRGPTEPAHDGLKPGDLWWKQAAHSTHVTQILTWDGTRFAKFDLAANDIVAVGTISAGHLASDSVTADKLVSGSVNADKLAANSVNADKIVSNAITADKIAANAVTAVKIAARTITSDKVAAGQFKGYVFTGAVFQSSEAANTGVKLNSTALQMWDSNHKQTVYLDGKGKSNLLTGTFQTRTSGHRIRISPNFKASLVGGTETFTGDGLEFMAYKGSAAYYSHPTISSLIQSNQVGEMGELDLWSGRVAKHDPAALLQLQSKPRKKGGTGSEGVTSQVFATANTDYDEPDASKKSSASLTLSGDSQKGSNVWLEAVDGNGSVGIGANIATGYVYLGGYLGGITNRFTFQSTNWRIYQNATLTAGSTVPQTTWSWPPAKYGRYYGVCNSDLGWGSIFMHVCNTGGAGSMQVMGYNAGNATYKGDMYVNAFAWLTK